MKSQSKDEWAVATGYDNGKPVIYRYVVKPPKEIEITEYPNLIIITWTYDRLEKNGMPATDIDELMLLLEELLETKLEGSCSAYFTVITTGNGQKEWHWYSRDVQETTKLLNEALSDHAAFPIQVSNQDDIKWSAYHNIVNAAQ